MTSVLRRALLAVCLALLTLSTSSLLAPLPTIDEAIIGESGPVTPEISTAQLRKILQAGTTPVLDVRSAEEYALAHIPGSLNFYEKELEQIIKAYPAREAALVLYCNGPYCGKSKRLSEELKKNGYTMYADISLVFRFGGQRATRSRPT